MSIPALLDPFEETFHLGPLAPQQLKESPGIELLRLGAEKCFQSPAQIGTSPGTQAVALRYNPVVPESIQHATCCPQPRVAYQRRARHAQSDATIPASQAEQE